MQILGQLLEFLSVLLGISLSCSIIGGTYYSVIIHKLRKSAKDYGYPEIANISYLELMKKNKHFF